MATPTLIRRKLIEPAREEEWVDLGWKPVEVKRPDGTTEVEYIPLTAEEFLHPQEGYRLPNSTFHDDICTIIRDILSRLYADDPTVGVFRDLLVVWDDPKLRRHSPDVFVVFNLKDKDKNRSRFNVAKEGTRPSLIIEVVSPGYRKEDRVTKVKQYAQAGVQEYVIIDRREQPGGIVQDEILGYRLVEGNRYQPIALDEKGRILCQTVGLWLHIPKGQMTIEGAQSGLRLLTSQELERVAHREQKAREAAEARIRELEARLKNQ
jgi:Uma2 family endonuclease